MLVFSHYSHTANVGDKASGPYHYFPFPAYTVSDIHKAVPTGPVVVVGGGAVANKVAAIVEANAGAKVIAWGVGDSRHGQVRPADVSPGTVLYGSREWAQPGTVYVPCASCMSPLFDSPVPITEDVVLFTNAGARIVRDYPVQITGVPHLQNNVSMEEAVAFLGSAQTVLTNSYHGAYWATLLGRRVVIVNPYSSKFHNFKFQPAIAAQEDWMQAARHARSFPEALADARAASRSFYERVLPLLAA